MTPLHRPRIALAALAAALLIGLAVPTADARLPRARPYQAGGPITLDTDLLSKSGVSAWAIDAYLAATTPLPPLGAAFMAAEGTYGINARFLLAAALHESAWGRSYISRVKHNLFGYNAYDRDPMRYANSYATYAANIDDTAKFIKGWYLTAGGRWWAGQPTLRAMQLSWSSSHGWGVSVSRIATSIHLASFAGGSIRFADPVVSGTLHRGDAAAIDVRWTGSAIPGAVQFLATWTPIQLDAEVAAQTMASLRAGEAGPADDASAGAGPSAAAPSPGAAPPAPAGIPALRTRSGAHDIGLRAVAPTEPGRYTLGLQMLDAGGGPLPASEQAAIPSVGVRVWGDRAVSYDVQASADGTGASIRITNTGRLPIPARDVLVPATTRIPEVEIARSVVAVTASAIGPDDPTPITVFAAPLDADLPPGGMLAVEVPAIEGPGAARTWLSVGLTVLGDPTWLAAYPAGGAWFSDPTAEIPGPAGAIRRSAPAPDVPTALPPASPGRAAASAPTPSPRPAPVPSPKPAPVTTLYQEHSGAIAYHGSWGDAPYAGYLGGDAMWSKTAGSTATLTFVGSSVSWVGPVGPTRGLALVLVDGQAVTRVNLWRSSFVPRATVFSRSFGGSGRHTLAIEVLPMPAHPYVVIDAFEVRS